ncbi:uncharacterized protein TNCV_2064761 [Trichonephila clavipes]|nr:uncharacterized protein TNCV_2064761 [Trichonephila clavipes]
MDKLWRTYFAAMAALMNIVGLGMISAFTASASVDMKKPGSRFSNITSNQITWIASLPSITAIFGNLLSATRGLLATDHVILNHGQVTWTTPELAPPLLTTTPHQQEDVSALDRFNVHRCPTRRVFSGTGIELMTCLPWLDTLTTGLPQPLWRSESQQVVLFS